MTVSKNAIKQAQQILKDHVEPLLKVDGDFGSKSIAAAQKWIVWSFKGTPTPDRWVAAIIQKEAIDKGIMSVSYDAFYGPNTEDARYRLIGPPSKPRPDEVVSNIPSSISTECRNPSSSEFTKKYGAVGTNQTTVKSPYALTLDWDLSSTISSFTCNKAVAISILESMEEILAVYGIDKIKELGLDRFGGCLNVRLKRGGTTYSTHSWGTAVDWYPSVNTLRESKKTARFAKAEYTKFLDIWAKNGWMSLGRCYDFDWMHIQKNP